jgi:hypothetical protein
MRRKDLVPTTALPDAGFMPHFSLRFRILPAQVLVSKRAKFLLERREIYVEVDRPDFSALFSRLRFGV